MAYRLDHFREATKMIEDRPRRAFLYLRFSSSKQRELSIEGQRDVCTEYAQKHNITIMGEYVDRAQSGRKESRADFQRLIHDAGAGVVDCVLVWKYDRFFRDRVESALYRRQLEAAGVQLVSVTEYIPEGSAGVITQGMIETVAEYFSAKLSEDVMRGMITTASKAQSTGGRCLGYRTGDDKKYHIDPVGAEVVKRIFEWYDSGRPMRELAAQLNEEGHHTVSGGQFAATSFSSILRNKKYIGLYEYGGTVTVAGGIPRIIEDDLFFRVQRRLEANRHRPGAYKAQADYLLSGKAFCGHCGEAMVGTAGTSKTGARHHYYICKGRKAKTCHKHNERVDVLERAVLDAVAATLTDENIAYISVEVERRCAEQSENRALLQSLQGQLAEADRRRLNIGAAIAQGIITETTKELLMAAEADRAAILRQIDQANVRAALEVRAESVACWLDGFRRGDKSDPGFRAQILTALVHSVYVYDDRLKIIFNPEEGRAVEVPYTALDGAGENSSYLDGSGSPQKSGLLLQAALLLSPALTISEGRTIIKTQGDARCKQAPPRGGNPTVATNIELTGMNA